MRTVSVIATVIAITAFALSTFTGGWQMIALGLATGMNAGCTGIIYWKTAQFKKDMHGLSDHVGKMQSKYTAKA